VKIVLDASALLAFLQGEPGTEVVQGALARGADLSAVNLAETLAKLADWGIAADLAVAELVEKGLLHGIIELVPFTEDDALEVARMRPLTRDLGLSLGDRACLALAKRLGLRALSADRAWLQGDLGIEVQLIR
jgi:PIN domain nuclease of toxin-antitoxin system